MSQPIQTSEINSQVPAQPPVKQPPSVERLSMTDKLMRTDRPTAIKAVITAILCIIAFCLIVFGDSTTKVYGLLLALIVGGVYAYLYRVRLKKFIGISDSINVGAKYYKQHSENLDKLRLRMEMDSNFMSESDYQKYKSMVQKMKTIGDLIADPAERSRFEYNTNLLRDTATEATNFSNPYVSKL